MGSSEGGCSSHSHVTLTAGPLDVLDLGCGTGLAGGWLKDYCKTLVGIVFFFSIFLSLSIFLVYLFESKKRYILIFIFYSLEL